MKKAKKPEVKKDTKINIQNSTPGVYQLIDVAKTKPSKSNYRKTFRKAYIDELTESVKAKGILEPILVRPHGKDYEVVFGSCRRLAAINAKLKVMPAIIKDLSDAEALEAQLIENSHRENPNPMEEADGFKRLLDMGKHTAETLAVRLGKTTSYVYGRLKLLDLPEKVKDLIAEEQISAGHAVVLIRLRDKKKQEDIAQRIVSQGMSVRDTAQAVKNCSVSLKEAVFDTAKCGQCEFNTNNQALLFPDVKKTGECTDVNCFAVKLKAYYEDLAKDLRAQGFKVITTEKEINSINDRTAERICAPEAKEYQTKPKKYKSECMKCTEHHVFYFFEKKQWDNSKEFVTGELCINKKCLDAMNRTTPAPPKSGGEPEGNGRVSPHTIAAHARACRDRFLRAQLPGKVDDSEVLRKRLLIYHILSSLVKSGLWQEIYKVFEGYLKGKKPIRSFGWVDDSGYDAIAAIKAEELDQVIHGLLVAGIVHMEPSVLLAMTPEAGIDMTKDFGPDEEFLNSKTKDELIKFIGTHKLAVEVPKSGKKGEIVKAILTQDLRGKLTKELKKEVEIEA
ncbi:MAG: ParB/RepB/Spo0J family partition protein [Nitrospirae bacterium]|nr:MAG: ParB/RepB/Spo0J family partition protein [Nitrospirota bacterium]